MGRIQMSARNQTRVLLYLSCAEDPVTADTVGRVCGPSPSSLGSWARPHLTALIKAGLARRREVSNTSTYRITPKGRASLERLRQNGQLPLLVGRYSDVLRYTVLQTVRKLGGRCSLDALHELVSEGRSREWLKAILRSLRDRELVAPVEAHRGLRSLLITDKGRALLDGTAATDASEASATVHA